MGCRAVWGMQGGEGGGAAGEGGLRGGKGVWWAAACVLGQLRNPRPKWVVWRWSWSFGLPTAQLAALQRVQCHACSCGVLPSVACYRYA